jgi:steroid delta-isomerase-like uncharacterized protein
MSEENKAVVRRFIDEVWNNGNLDAIDELVSEDQVDHDPGRPPDMPGGPEGMHQFVQMYRAAYPDTHLEIGEIVAEGDLVAYTWTATGTHQGELMGIPPTGKSVTVTGMALDRIRDGKIVESWGNYDSLGMLVQLGVVPAPAGAAA